MRSPDPRAMLLIAACFSTMGVLVEATWLLACVLAAAVLCAAALRAPLPALLKRFRGLVRLVLGIALLQSVFGAQGKALLSVGGFAILTEGGARMAANTFLRIGTVVASASIFTLTTSRAMIQGLIQFGVPYELAFMASVALRFLPVFSEEFRDTVTAIQLRGVDLKKVPIREKIKIYGKVLMPVVYGAVDRAQKLSYAMELRAFRVYPTRTSRTTLKLSRSDWVWIAASPALTAAVLSVYYLYL